MKHTWNYIRKVHLSDSPDYWEETNDKKLNEWAKCRAVFASRQTGEMIIRRIKTVHMEFWSKIYYGMTFEEARDE